MSSSYAVIDLDSAQLAQIQPELAQVQLSGLALISEPGAPALVGLSLEQSQLEQLRALVGTRLDYPLVYGPTFDEDGTMVDEGAVFQIRPLDQEQFGECPCGSWVASNGRKHVTCPNCWAPLGLT
jgi:hypothetical protein